MALINDLGNLKGQIFSIATLIFVLLMVSAMLTLVIVSIGYDGVAQSVIISSGSNNYGSILQKSAGTFAYGSGSAALNALFKYEYNVSLRKTNLISNFSQYMQYLMVNGTLPNVAANSLAANSISAMMANATLAAYNSLIPSLTGTSPRAVTINESKPEVFQTNPYSISVSYVEHVGISTQSGTSSYVIPVNVSIPLNNTPDLFYAQQGVYLPIKSSSLNGLVTPVGNAYASSGNTMGYTYGTVYNLPYSSTCTSVPGPLNTNPYDTQVIIVDANALAISSCSSYGGFITNNAVSSSSIPYLVVSTGMMQGLQTGQQILLYGPSLAILNVTGLVNNVSYGSYFTSPFAASFSQRASGNIQQQSSAGIFTLSGISNKQAAQFNGATSYVSTGTTGLPYGNAARSVSAWIYPTGSCSSNCVIYMYGTDSTNPYGYGLYVTSSYHIKVEFDSSDGAVISNKLLSPNTWYHVVTTYSGSTSTIYINGIPDNSISYSSANTLAGSSNIGQWATNCCRFQGLLANIQVYNSSLSNYQASELYQRGIEGLPITGANVVGWWPLNGNVNSLSGVNSISTANQITFGLLPNYGRDSALGGNATALINAIPGLSNCNTVGQCASNTLQHLYLSNQPLTIANSRTTTAYFDQSSSCVSNGYVPILVPQLSKASLGALTVTGWIRSIQTSGVFFHLDSSQGAPGGNGIYCSFGSSFSCPVPPSSTISSPAVSVNNWYFFTLTLSSSGTATAYVNGQAGTAGTWNAITGLSGITDFDLFGYSSGCSDWANGQMSNVQLYNAALSPSQISQLYGEGITGPPILVSNIIGWWPLNGDTQDYSGNNNNGIPNSIAFEYINIPQGTISSSNTMVFPQLQSGTVNGGWQALGFGSPP